MTALLTAAAVVAVLLLVGWVVRALLRGHRAAAGTSHTRAASPLMQRVRRTDKVTPEYVENGIRDLQRWLAEQPSSR